MSERRCLHCSAACDGDFCCAGCGAAHALVVGAGLSRWQALADRPLPKGGAPQRRPWLDGQDVDAGVVVDVQGISCGACVFLIEELGRRRGVVARVNPGVGVVDVDGGVDRAAVDAFFDDVETLGYRLGPPSKRADGDVDGLVVRAGVCAAAAMAAMSFSFSRYLGLGADVDGGGDVALVFFAGEFIAAVVAVVVGGSFFFVSAWRALRLGMMAFDLPIATGIALAFAGSVASAVVGRGDAVFFDSVAMFVALMIGGRLAQRALLARSRAQVLESSGLESLAVVRLNDGVPESTTAACVRAGDRLLVRPGDAIVVDVVVEAGAADFSLAWIDGEPEARHFDVGATIAAGACHADGGAVVVRALQDGAASKLAALLSRRDDDGRGAAGGFGRFAAASVAGVLVVAAVAFVGWTVAASAVDGLRIATTVLVVTCPCAFGLALPLVDELAVARLRARGVYVRRSGFFERLARVRHVVLDKTGTLTVGALRLSSSSTQALAALDGGDKDALFQLVARSAHPKSRAVAELLGRRPLDAAVVVVEERGRGLSGVVGGRRIALRAAPRGLVLAVDERQLLVLEFDEVLQDDAAVEVEGVKARGLAVHIASGDDPARAAAVGRVLGVDDVRGGLAPDDKAEFVEDLEAAGDGGVLFVGDGINDAAAFAAASVAGTPALERPQLPARADFYVVGGGTGPLSLLLDTARDWRRAKDVVVAASVVFNVVAVGAAVAGLLSPLACAVLMPASSIAVVMLARISLRGGHRGLP